MTNPYANKTPEERKAIIAKSIATRRRNIAEREERKREALALRDTLICEIKNLKEELAGLQKIKIFNKAAITLTNKTLISPEEIVKSSNPWQRATGVYFLISNYNIVYVGQSVNIYGRLQDHTDKQFDSFSFIPCEKNILDKLESLYIHVLQPKLNGSYSNGSVKNAPMSLKQLIGM